MPLGLSPYVTSTPASHDAWTPRRGENDRPSPLRIHKQPAPIPSSKEQDKHQLFYQSQVATQPLQHHTSNRLNVVKRRSLWGLSSQLAENEEHEIIPPRPYSVGPDLLFKEASVQPVRRKEDSVGPRIAEEAEELLREASRTYSGASNDSNSWNSFVSGGCSVRKMSGTQSSSSVVRHASSSTDGPSCTISMDSILPHVLSPHISIYTNSHDRYFGQDHVWAAIEVSGILSHAYSADGSEAKPAQPKQDEHHLDLFFKHGCLHDLKIEILPVEGSTVLQVFHEQTFPTILYAGSIVLILAQIGINSRSTTRYSHGAHQRQRSDELIADLESQLGDSQMPYMKVRVTYSHSAFSDYFGHEILVGVSQRCTKLETTAIGALKRHNVRSPWSPQPVYSFESIKSVMKKHWKLTVVEEWLQRMRNPVVAHHGAVDHRNGPGPSSLEGQSRTPIDRPSLSMEEMCQRMASNRVSEPRHLVHSPHYGIEKRESQHDRNLGSMRSRRSGARNTSGTTSTTGSLKKKKSFAAGIWRSLTPSNNTSKAEGAEPAQGAWNWNAWF